MLPQMYTANTTITPVLVQTEQTGYTRKCLEDSALADLNAKQLQGEQFTEEDAARIIECIAQKKAGRNNFVMWAIIIGVIVVIVAAIFMFTI